MKKGDVVMCKSKRFMMRTLALIALVSVLVTSAFAFNTYKPFSSVSISGGGGKSVTDTASISAATYKATISSNSSGSTMQATLYRKDGHYSSSGYIYGTGNTSLTVGSSGSYYLYLRESSGYSTTVSGYWRSLS